MKLYKIFLLTIVELVCLQTNAVNTFKLDISDESVSIIEINKVFSENSSISPFSFNHTISGLGISGSIEKRSEEYLVRIILIDIDNREYLVLESNNMLNDDTKIVFKDYCEETRLLSGISPKVIKVVTRNADINLTNIKYVKNRSNINTDSTQTLNIGEIKKEQVKAKIEKINSYNYKHNKLWRAGITQLSLKRKLFFI